MLGRWGRAKRLLTAGETRVLDAGCAFGFGTAQLRPKHNPVGLEISEEYLAAAHTRYPDLPLVRGDVTCLPFLDGSLDAVLFLDVLEHLPDPAAAISEARRVLREDGALIISVPYQGRTAFLDSLNSYSRLARRMGWSPLADDEQGYPVHRHFTADEMAGLADGFKVERVDRTGVGLGEPANLVLLALFRGLLRQEKLYRWSRFLAFGLSVLDDLIPAGPLGYNLYLRASKGVRQPRTQASSE